MSSENPTVDSRDRGHIFSESRPVGVRIIGELDPREFSHEEFLKSPDLLFHGAANSFPLKGDFDYRSEEYSREHDGSTTLGFGFYATDNKEEAQRYSLQRQGPQREAPKVMELLPHQARVLDLRATNDRTKNAPFPRELVEKWVDYYRDYFKKRQPREGNVGAILDTSEAEYLSYIISASSRDQVDLRVLLETAPDKILKSRNLPSPTWTILFSEFMRKEGFDGIVYIEGGEGYPPRHAPSFVFYNPQKIGTYEDWKQRTTSGKK